ncbi:hypothetical protein VS837_29060, partial [Klebsiella pneumoniae]
GYIEGHNMLSNMRLCSNVLAQQVVQTSLGGHQSVDELLLPEEHIYYAHAYSSWERGSNENHNRLIRRWLPKGTKKTTPKEVAFIENWINNYPKKCLDYKSPSEFLLGG